MSRPGDIPIVNVSKYDVETNGRYAAVTLHEPDETKYKTLDYARKIADVNGVGGLVSYMSGNRMDQREPPLEFTFSCAFPVVIEQVGQIARLYYTSYPIKINDGNSATYYKVPFALKPAAEGGGRTMYVDAKLVKYRVSKDGMTQGGDLRAMRALAAVIENVDCKARSYITIVSDEGLDISGQSWMAACQLAFCGVPPYVVATGVLTGESLSAQTSDLRIKAAAVRDWAAVQISKGKEIHSYVTPIMLETNGRETVVGVPEWNYVSNFQRDSDMPTNNYAFRNLSEILPLLRDFVRIVTKPDAETVQAQNEAAEARKQAKAAFASKYTADTPVNVTYKDNGKVLKVDTYPFNKDWVARQIEAVAKYAPADAAIRKKLPNIEAGLQGAIKAGNLAGVTDIATNLVQAVYAKEAQGVKGASGGVKPLAKPAFSFTKRPRAETRADEAMAGVEGVAAPPQRASASARRVEVDVNEDE